MMWKFVTLLGQMQKFINSVSSYDIIIPVVHTTCVTLLLHTRKLTSKDQIKTGINFSRGHFETQIADTVWDG